MVAFSATPSPLGVVSLFLQIVAYGMKRERPSLYELATKLFGRARQQFENIGLSMCSSLVCIVTTLALHVFLGKRSINKLESRRTDMTQA